MALVKGLAKIFHLGPFNLELLTQQRENESDLTPYPEQGKLFESSKTSVWSAGTLSVKYFFLSDGWIIGRVWEFGGIWNEVVWRRKPQIEPLNMGIVEHQQTLWLYRVEEAVLMVEVKPMADSPTNQTIGQVVLKRLIDAEQVIERLGQAESVVHRFSEG
nr:hypothetical protein [Roseofilum capinflatum]